MKLLLYTTLLVAGTAGNVFVFGQTYSEGAAIGRPLVQALRTSPSAVIPVPGSSAADPWSWYPGRSASAYLPSLPEGDSVRIMGPDRMPCLVPSTAATERMPVKKLDSRLVRPMPNGVPNGWPRLKLMPKRRPD